MHSSRRAPAVESKAGTRNSIQLKVCKNPHTGEIIETKGGNNKGLKEWESEHRSVTILVEFVELSAAPLRCPMNSELTEEEMRRALFGTDEPGVRVSASPVQEPAPEVVLTKPAVAPPVKKVITKAFTPRLRVTLRVGNEFEGKMHELIHEADTLSSLLAEQEAVKAARKKYKYVELVSVKSM